MKWSFVAAGAALVVVGGAGGWWWGRHAVHPPVTSEAKPADVLYWYDPMVPQQHFDKPGKSPFMDMQLVPRYATDAAASSGVQITPAVQQNLGVRLASVESIAVSSQIDATAILGFNERDVAVVQSRVAGIVQKVSPLAPGDLIEAGASIAELLVPEWAAAEQELLAVRASGDAGLVQAARDRLHLIGLEASEIARLDSEGTARSSFHVRAPISGLVQALDIRMGMTLVAGQTLVRINGLSTVWLEVAVPESLAGEVQVGDTAQVRLASPGAPPVVGRVSALLPTLNEATRTLRIRVELANPGGVLRPGQSAQVTLSAKSKAAALAVPTEAVIRTGKRSLVMLSHEGSFRRVEVTLGQEVGDRTVIVSGLEAGQQVVASGQFLLDSEASLRGLGTPAMEQGQ
ncbi:MAG: efflux RND transporter periplasmic adaptor subunit [Proteobacteria bacterium]|nr:efflux RND transporter periplasmic adaptor subunit [Pseudomonadota bacterium]